MSKIELGKEPLLRLVSYADFTSTEIVLTPLDMVGLREFEANDPELPSELPLVSRTRFVLRHGGSLTRMAHSHTAGSEKALSHRRNRKLHSVSHFVPLSSRQAPELSRDPMGDFEELF